MNFERIYESLLEKYIENLVDVYIDGVGRGIAEADTGNSGYNVIHGIVQKIENGRVFFKTLNDRIVDKAIVEYITAVTGSSNEEQRPVVALDITVNGLPHSQIPFSISDRSSNEKKILLGKPFLKQITSFVKL